MRLLPCLSIALVLAAGSTTEAQTLLRWKLKVGDEFVVHTEQQTDSTVAFGSKSAQSKIDMTLAIRWKVEEASESAFAVRQTIERLTTKLSTATGSAEFDSTSKTRSTGLAKQLSDALQPLIGAEIHTRMNDRGEVLSVTAANSAAEALLKADPADAANSKSSVHQVVSQSILPLPNEEVAEGDAWQTVRELTTPAGALKQETTYKLAGKSKRNNKELFQIESLSKLTAPAATPDAKAPIAIKEHEQAGSFFFDADRGRVVESEQTQKLVTERVYRDTTIKVTLVSKQATKVE